MNILFVASEAVPFAKTGGLGDVVGALPRAIERLGHQVAVVLPLYRQTRECGQPLDETSIRVEIPIGRKTVAASVLRSTLPNSNVPVYLVDQPAYYNRDALYAEKGKDYVDNCERFVFLSRGALELARQLPQTWDVVHAHDWQTGLVPAYVSQSYRENGRFRHAATLFTIHNMAYQGRFWHWDMILTGLDWGLFNWRQLEFYGELNLLKAGIVFADAVSTVSRRYAAEIQTPEFSHGLDGVLQWRRAELHGIVNGVDYDVWNPESDRHLAAWYSDATFQHGKPQCKAALQAQQRLPVRSDVPLIGMIGRLDPQKGWDLVAEIADRLLSCDVQLAVLGTGHRQFEVLLEDLARRYPSRVGVNFAFDESLAHQIEAGADMFLMPSHYEPCGLNQMFSLRYGTVPIVRATGGLANTVVDTTPETLAAGTATGFVFREYTADALWSAVLRALDYWTQPAEWRAIVRHGMRQDWSWTRSAREYVALYEQLCRR